MVGGSIFHPPGSARTISGMTYLPIGGWTMPPIPPFRGTISTAIDPRMTLKKHGMENLQGVVFAWLNFQPIPLSLVWLFALLQSKGEDGGV